MLATPSSFLLSQSVLGPFPRACIRVTGSVLFRDRLSQAVHIIASLYVSVKEQAIPSMEAGVNTASGIGFIGKKNWDVHPS